MAAGANESSVVMWGDVDSKHKCGDMLGNSRVWPSITVRLSALQQFHSRHGKAYLFNTVVNVSGGEREERLMTTGMHIVRDIHCTGCMQVVGWKYVSQPYSPPAPHVHVPVMSSTAKREVVRVVFGPRVGRGGGGGGVHKAHGPCHETCTVPVGVSGARGPARAKAEGLPPCGMSVSLWLPRESVALERWAVAGGWSGFENTKRMRGRTDLPFNPRLSCHQDEAFEKGQKYKEGKFILEREKIVETESHLTDCVSLLRDVGMRV